MDYSYLKKDVMILAGAMPSLWQEQTILQPLPLRHDRR